MCIRDSSGTSARLLTGLLSSQKFRSVITGDQSLSKRPMKSISDPLSTMNAKIFTTDGSLPIVIEGTIKRNKPIRVLRDNIVIFEGELDSLKRFKDDANEVPMGTECGIGVANYRDVKVGDKIEVYDRIEVKRTLD